MDDQLARRIERCRDDFARQRGEPFEHFFCPILCRDEPVELCKGHIIPKGFGSSSTWLPQRADVDHLFGTLVEADAISGISNRGIDLNRIVANPKIARDLRLRFKNGDEVVEHYYPNTPNGTLPSDHSRALFEIPGEPSNTQLRLKWRPRRPLPNDFDLQAEVERDFVPQVTAAAIKSAHLTLFSLLGYRHLSSPCGLHFVSVLMPFLEQVRLIPRDNRREFVASYFRKWGGMVCPLQEYNDQTVQGTVADRRCVFLTGSSGRIWAVGPAVRFGNDLFCVFGPLEEETYRSFLSERPPFVHGIIGEFQYSADGGDFDGTWKLLPETSVKLMFPD